MSFQKKISPPLHWDSRKYLRHRYLKNLAYYTKTIFMARRLLGWVIKLPILLDGSFKGTGRNSSKAYHITDKKQHPSNKTSLHPSRCRDFPWANWIWGKKSTAIMASSFSCHWGIHVCWAACHYSKHVKCLDDRQLYEIFLSVSACVCGFFFPVCVCAPTPEVTSV